MACMHGENESKTRPRLQVSEKVRVAMAFTAVTHLGKRRKKLRHGHAKLKLGVSQGKTLKQSRIMALQGLGRSRNRPGEKIQTGKS